jgi:hypothetical protein
MVKKIIAFSALAFTLAVAVPALAETNTAVNTTSTASVPMSQVISCVGSAVATREAALGAGITTNASAASAAYTARASALASAYTATTSKELRMALNTAWSAFNTSMKSARKDWMKTRNGAWSAFRTAARACKATSLVTDSAHASAESSGD